MQLHPLKLLPKPKPMHGDGTAGLEIKQSIREKPMQKQKPMLMLMLTRTLVPGDGIVGLEIRQFIKSTGY